MTEILLFSGIMNLLAGACFAIVGLNDETNLVWIGIAFVFVIAGAFSIGTSMKQRKRGR